MWLLHVVTSDEELFIEAAGAEKGRGEGGRDIGRISYKRQVELNKGNKSWGN